MSVHVNTTMKGKGIGSAVNFDKTRNLLEHTDGRYVGYDVKRLDEDTVTFDSRNAVPLAGIAELSRSVDGPVAITSAKESDFYQIERSLRFEKGVITGQCVVENFDPDNPPKWPGFTPVSPAESKDMMDKHCEAVRKSMSAGNLNVPARNGSDITPPNSENSKSGPEMR